MKDKLIELLRNAASGFAQRWKEFFDYPDREDCENCAHNGKNGTPCNECFLFSRWEKIMTNAERIRAMSDDELAAVFSTACLGCIVKDCKLHNHASYGCEKKFLNWLKQPVEVCHDTD